MSNAIFKILFANAVTAGCSYWNDYILASVARSRRGGEQSLKTETTSAAMAKVINQLLIYDHKWTTHLRGVSILIGWVS